MLVVFMQVIAILSHYYNSGEEDSRNIKFYATGTSATSFSFQFIESLMLSPFHWGQGDVQALFGIQHFDLTLNFENLNRILSGTVAGWCGTAAPTAGIFNAGGNINNISVTVSGTPGDANLHLTWLITT